MGKYAVIGDSYAVVDERDSHWAKIWAEKHNHDIDFFGLEGGNLVNISYLFENIPFEKYDGFIIHYTSGLRAEGATCSELKNKKLSTIMQMTDVYSDESKPMFNYIHPKGKKIQSLDPDTGVAEGFEFQYYNNFGQEYLITYHNMMPHWYDNFQLIDGDTSSYDYIMTELCNKFYDSVSIRWLQRASFLAYRNIILNLEAHNIKNITIFPVCGGFKQTIDHIKDKYPNTQIWDQTNFLRIHPKEVSSRNHISLEHAQLLAEKFSF